MLGYLLAKHMFTQFKNVSNFTKPVDATDQMKILTEVHSVLLQTMAGNLLGI